MILRVGIEHSILCTIYVNWVTVSRQEWTIVIFDICLGRVSQKYHKGNLLFKNTIIKVKAASTYLYAVWKIWQHGAYLKINVALSFTLCCICHSTHLLVLYFHYFIYSTQDSALNNTYYMKLSKFQETSFVKNIDRNIYRFVYVEIKGKSRDTNLSCIQRRYMFDISTSTQVNFTRVKTRKLINDLCCQQLYVLLLSL